GRRSQRLSVEALEAREVPAAFTLTDLHSAGEYLLQLFNQARANPAAAAARLGIDLNEGLAPGTISTAAKQPLAPNPQLLTSIENHLTWWVANFNSQSTFDGNSTDPRVNPHYEPGGVDWSVRAARAGYANPQGVGENLAARWQSNSVTELQSI